MDVEWAEQQNLHYLLELFEAVSREEDEEEKRPLSDKELMSFVKE